MNALYTAIPRIETLVLNSFLWNLTFEQFVAHLSRFRDLQTLSIPEVNNLGLEYRPAPRWVIEQYASGRNVPDQIWEKMANEGRQFRTNVAKAIFAACPWLKELWFLDSIRMTVKEGLDDTSRKAFATRRELDFVEVECDRPMWMWL
ncbi:hypothetical protein D9758_017723 [Tetrapyrgos nigripes]|uniref:Uncharacterized protein n=1 Tax=Tetrapyrgos nigripes TaxID=182062 RepID=A0A8H5BB24_9AGAR|nr:hypothetical protein D9758_017723 [Tetrapyrgos nigripes]